MALTAPSVRTTERLSARMQAEQRALICHRRRKDRSMVGRSLRRADTAAYCSRHLLSISVGYRERRPPRLKVATLPLTGR
jgi:hypothetical protein